MPSAYTERRGCCADLSGYHCAWGPNDGCDWSPCHDGCDEDDLRLEMRMWKNDCICHIERRRPHRKRCTQPCETFAFYSQRFCRTITVRAGYPCMTYHRPPRMSDTRYCYKGTRPVPLKFQPVDTSKLPGCFDNVIPDENAPYTRCCPTKPKRRPPITNLPGRFEEAPPDACRLYERVCHCKTKPECRCRYVRMNLPECFDAGSGENPDAVQPTPPEEPPYGDIPEEGLYGSADYPEEAYPVSEPAEGYAQENSYDAGYGGGNYPGGYANYPGCGCPRPEEECLFDGENYG